jgi:hypothetical protein
MKIVNVDYDQFKSLVSSKDLRLQFVDHGTSYEFFAIESNVCWQTSIDKDGGIDQVDFETNYKETANAPLEYRSIDGLPKMANARFVDNLSFYVDGSQGTLNAIANQTTYTKYNFSYNYTLAGLDVYWYDSNWGDYLDCEVGFYLDPENETTFQVISTFSNQYKVYLTGNRTFDVTTVKTIPPTITISGNTFDIIIRISYVNVGPNNAKAILNLIGWK